MSSRGAREGGTTVEAGPRGTWAPKWEEPRGAWDGIGGLRPLWPPQRTSPRTLQKIPLRIPQRMMAPVSARRVSLSKAPVQILVPPVMAAPRCSRSGKGQGLPLSLLCFWAPKLPKERGWVVPGSFLQAAPPSGQS